jgi:hypothetical protein
MTQALTNKNKGGGGGLSGGAGTGGRLLKTRQTTAYHVGDDGDLEPGLPVSYTVLTAGQFSGTTAIDTPHYAANGISFAAPSTINDAGAGLVTFLDTDTIRVRGSTLNDGVYTIAAGGGGAAGAIVVNEITIVNEIAGPYVTICKRSAPSNNVVIDNVTGRMWKRNTTGTVGSVERVGPASDGKLNWYGAATSFSLHPAAADLQMIAASKTLRIVGGAAELPYYFAGMIIVCTGFANAVNNLPGYRVVSVTVNGADLDILLWTGNNTLIAEAAAGARTISVICRSVYAYCGAANAASFGGYTDWRNPSDVELQSLKDMEALTAVPDAVAFPNWSTDYIFSSTTRPSSTANAMEVDYGAGGEVTVTKATVYAFCELVRG